MAEICPVCEKEVHPSYRDEVEGAVLHVTCFRAFIDNKDIFKKKYIELNGERKNLKAIDFDFANKEAQEEQAKQAEANFNKLLEQAERDEASLQEIKDKSVYVKGFRMPFGEMVTFIFKWTMASIPTAIFLAILFAIFLAISA